MSFGLSDAIENIRATRPSDARRSDAQPVEDREANRPPRPPLPVRLSSKIFANFSHSRSIPKADKTPSPKPKPGFTPFDPTHLGIPDEAEEDAWNKPGGRVTVEFPSGKDSTKDAGDAGAPILHLRFSALNMPSVTQLVSGFSQRTPTNTNSGTDLEMNSVSNRADQGSHQQDAVGRRARAGDSSRRASLAGIGAGIRTRFSQVFGTQPSDQRQSAGQAAPSRPVSMLLAPPTALRPSQAPQRVSLGVGPVEHGDWILIKKENQDPTGPPARSADQRQSNLLSIVTPDRRRFRGSMAMHSRRPSTDSAPDSALSYATGITASASETGNTQGMAEIVQAQSVTVSTQMSTLLYSPQMGGIVGAQILQESSSPSPRNQLKLHLASGYSTPESGSPRKHLSEIPPPSPSHLASGSGLARAMTSGARQSSHRPSNLGSSNDARGAPNEAGDYFSLRPETLDVTGARVRIRTPTIISNAETRKSVPLEHGWTPIAEETGEDWLLEDAHRPQGSSTQSSPLTEQQEFDRFQHNYTQNLLLGGTTEDDGDRQTILPAYENHRRDVLALADPVASATPLRPAREARPQSGALGGLGDII